MSAETEGANDIVKGAEAAAKVVGLTAKEIYYLVATNGIPYRKIGHLLYFNRSALLAAFKP